MGPFTRYPYTNFQELNLDWILNTVKDLFAKTDNIDKNIVTEVDRKLEEMNAAGELTVTAEDLTARADISTINSRYAANDLHGKQILVYGDSIAWGLINNLGDRSANPWPEVMCERLGAVCTNRAVSGGCMSTYDANSFSTIVAGLTAADLAPFDYLILAYGVNDAYFGHYLVGSDNSAFVNAYEYSLDKIYSLKPSIKVILCTCYANGTPDQKFPPSNVTQRMINRAIYRVAEDYSLPVIDFANWAGVNARNLSALSWDGVHYNNDGYLFLGEFAARAVAGTNPQKHDKSVRWSVIDPADHSNGDKITITTPALDWNTMLLVTNFNGEVCIGAFDNLDSTQVGITIGGALGGNICALTHSSDFVSLTVDAWSQADVTLEFNKTGSPTADLNYIALFF